MTNECAEENILKRTESFKSIDPEILKDEKRAE